MSDESNRPKNPSHHAFQINEGADGKSYFNRVGVAFEHKDKQGFNLQLDSMPVNGKVTLRTPQDRLKAQKEGTQSKGRDKEHDR